MRLTHRLILLVLILGNISACAPTDETATFRVEAPAVYNHQIDRGWQQQESWTATPRQITEHLIGPPEKEAGPVTYQQLDHPNGTVTLTVTEEGVLDDEIYGQRRVFTFILKDRRWTVQQVKVGYKCQPDDQAYSGQGCGR